MRPAFLYWISIFLSNGRGGSVNVGCFLIYEHEAFIHIRVMMKISVKDRRVGWKFIFLVIAILCILNRGNIADAQ